MSQSISLLGATYSNVPGVDLPKTGGGTARFTDVTPTTASISDVADGKIFFDSAGVQQTGIASGGGSGVVVVETLDEHGGTIVEITAEEIHLATKSITQNGTYTAEDEDLTGYSSVTVNVAGGSPNLQAKTGIDPTESSQTITADTGYDGLSSVQIDAISSSYVGSGITRRSSSDLTASGATVTVPSGYYSSQATKSVTSGSVTAPSTISGTSASISSQTGKISLTQNVTVTPNVTTAGYISSGTAGNSYITLSTSVTTQSSRTIHPSTTDQTIASGTYVTGTQTIKGVTVSGLSASSILSGTTVKIGDSTDDDCVTSVSGSVTFQTYYTGSSAPSASLGSNGDIYLQTS